MGQVFTDSKTFSIQIINQVAEEAWQYGKMQLVCFGFMEEIAMSYGNMIQSLIDGHG